MILSYPEHQDDWTTTKMMNLFSTFVLQNTNLNLPPKPYLSRNLNDIVCLFLSIICVILDRFQWHPSSPATTVLPHPLPLHSSTPIHTPHASHTQFLSPMLLQSGLSILVALINHPIILNFRTNM